MAVCIKKTKQNGSSQDISQKNTNVKLMVIQKKKVRKLNRTCHVPTFINPIVEMQHIGPKCWTEQPTSSQINTAIPRTPPSVAENLQWDLSTHLIIHCLISKRDFSSFKI